MFIDDETRLLLLDMAEEIETAFVVDRLSRMALQWDELVFAYDRNMAMIISPRATRGLTVYSHNPDFFMCVVNKYNVGRDDSAAAAYGDVIIDVCRAVSYAFERAAFEPVIPPSFPYVLRVRFGWRVCTVGISEEAAVLLGHPVKRVFGIHDRTLARFLVPWLYT